MAKRLDRKEFKSFLELRDYMDSIEENENYNYYKRTSYRIKEENNKFEYQYIRFCCKAGGKNFVSHAKERKSR